MNPLKYMPRGSSAGTRHTDTHICGIVCGASPRDADREDLAVSPGNADSSFFSKAGWKHGGGR